MTTYYAQPYDMDATGFYFEDAESYCSQVNTVQNSFGDKIEEFELQFIDGERIDAELARALGLYQNTILQFMEAVEDWDDGQKIKAIIAVGECGYNFDFDNGDPDGFDIDLYEVDSMKELAEQFLDDGLFGDIPENIRFYLDYEAIVRDLSIDYTETTINGQNYVYCCS